MPKINDNSTRSFVGNLAVQEKNVKQEKKIDKHEIKLDIVRNFSVDNPLIQDLGKNEANRERDFAVLETLNEFSKHYYYAYGQKARHILFSILREVKGGNTALANIVTDYLNRRFDQLCNNGSPAYDNQSRLARSFKRPKPDDLSLFENYFLANPLVAKRGDYPDFMDGFRQKVILEAMSSDRIKIVKYLMIKEQKLGDLARELAEIDEDYPMDTTQTLKDFRTGEPVIRDKPVAPEIVVKEEPIAPEPVVKEQTPPPQVQPREIVETVVPVTDDDRPEPFLATGTDDGKSPERIVKTTDEFMREISTIEDVTTPTNVTPRGSEIVTELAGGQVQPDPSPRDRAPTGGSTSSLAIGRQSVSEVAPTEDLSSREAGSSPKPPLTDGEINDLFFRKKTSESSHTKSTSTSETARSSLSGVVRKRSWTNLFGLTWKFSGLGGWFADTASSLNSWFSRIWPWSRPGLSA